MTTPAGITVPILFPATVRVRLDRLPLVSDRLPLGRFLRTLLNSQSLCEHLRESVLPVFVAFDKRKNWVSSSATQCGAAP